ncbi:MAG TPA: ATP-binding cassette domain-containing protein [Bryobacteraceae bacterium]|nr:ATP-binding cassette domain-containing protein [Bryobacteraceae bacterium]
MHHVVVEHWSRRNSVLHARDARLKIAAALTLLVAIALTRSPVALAAYGLLLTGLALTARLPVASVLLRAAYVLPFAATFALVSFLTGDRERALLLVAKSWLSAMAALVLVGTTPLPKLLSALQRLGAPPFLVDVVQTLYRYLFVVSEQAQHMRLAAACRGSLGRTGFRAAAGAVAVLFARSYTRAEDIHNAMLARSGSGLDDTREAKPLVSVRDLRFRYDDGTAALEGVNFDLAHGETVAVFGRNGSGKTTFVHHLNGLLTGEGEITVCGMRVERKTLASIRKRIGLVFQDSDTQLFMPSVLEDVAYGPHNLGLDEAAANRRAMEALRHVGLDHAAQRAPYHLSAGEKKRAALAGVLAMQPEILVLDEPTTFLDPPAVRDLITLLRGLPQAKILVTHDALFARALADRAVFFERGRIAAEGPVQDIIRSFDWDPRSDSV